MAENIQISNSHTEPLVFVEILDNRISMSVRTLKRKLLTYGLQKKNVNIDDQELRDIIKKEVETGHVSEYRKIWHILRINHHIHAPRKLVAQIVHDLDPQASKKRKENKLKRRKYMSYGPNHCWHIDGVFLNFMLFVKLCMFHMSDRESMS